MTIVTLRYWAAAKDAAGVAEESVGAATLSAALAAGLEAVRERAEAAVTGADRERSVGDPERLRLVLARSSFLVNGEPVGKRPPESVVLAGDAVIEVLPPFAGG